MEDQLTYERQGNFWIFSDGSRLPVVSGGSDTMDAGSGTAETEQSQETDSGQGSEDYSLAGGFLENVPEEHRPILEPYVKKWDAGVTRRFQELHSQYRPYQELGEYDQVSQAVQLLQILDENPRQVYDILAEHLKDELEQGSGNQDEFDFGEGEFQGLPPEIQEKLDRQEQALEMIANYILGNERSVQEAEEDAELESYLENLQAEFGEFDEDFVLAKMYNGMSGEQAVKAYQQAVQQAINAQSSGRAVPPVLSGGGAVPAQQQNVTELGRNDVKSLVANIMAQATSE